MDHYELVCQVLKEHDINSFGICPFPSQDQLLPCRNSVHIPKNACSVIMCAFSYYTGPSNASNLCMYARVPDYHLVVRNLLNPVCEQLSDLFSGYHFVCFTDVSALPERECARQAGLGIIGKNGMLIHPQYGSFFVIGEIVTDLTLPFSTPLTGSCIGCGRCISACPGNALSENGFCEARCLSAITQKKEELTSAEKEKIHHNKLAWGCDQCQLVCPHNSKLEITEIKEFSDHIEPVVTEENLSRLRKDRAFGYRSKSLMLRNLAILQENYK